MKFQSFGLGDPVKITATEDLGGKGAGLVWMSQNGFRVPPGFVIPTDWWAAYQSNPTSTLQAIVSNLDEYLQKLKDHFGYMPLLSVRSGARVSCPGMMDTILNVGIDGTTGSFWENKLGVKAYRDSYFRLISMYGDVVEGHDKATYLNLSDGDTPKVSHAYNAFSELSGHDFPDAKNQLIGSIVAVFNSWNNERAKVYRKLNNIPDDWGTAVTVQAMVFGNLNDKSATGVLFTRNPNTGEATVNGEYLVNAQGEDVVAGTHTPSKLVDMSNWNDEVLTELVSESIRLEKLKKDAQDIEFTIQDGVLYFLQTRNVKRTGVAAIRIALDMAKEGLIDNFHAISRVKATDLDKAQINSIPSDFTKAPSITGSPACSGVVCGQIVTSSQDAIDCKSPCILVTEETNPDDIAGMNAAVGVITMKGGTTSHAAVVARSLNKPCITGVGQTLVDFIAGVAGKDTVEDILKGTPLKLSMDGSTGAIWFEEIPIVQGQKNGLLEAYKTLLFSELEVLPIITEVPHKVVKEALFDASSYIGTTDELVDTIIKAAKKVKTLWVDLRDSTPAVASFRELFSYHEEIVITGIKERLADVKNIKYADESVITNLTDLVLADGEVSIAIPVVSPKQKEAVSRVLKWKGDLATVSFGEAQPLAKSFLSLQQALQLVAKQ